MVKAKTKQTPRKVPAGYSALGSVKIWCQICDTRQVDSQKPDTGNFYHVFGLQHAPETPPAAVFFAVCPHCKPTDIIVPVRNIEELLIRER